MAARQRGELQMAADVLARLFTTGALANQAAVMKHAAKLVGVPLELLRVAILALKDEQYRPPAGAEPDVVIGNGDGGMVGLPASCRPSRPAAARTASSPATLAAYARRRGVPAARPNERTNQDGTMSRLCTKCHRWLPLDRFGVKVKSTNGRWYLCRECRVAYQRDRYLGVEKVAAMNAARITFTVAEGSGAIGLGCTVCGQPIAVGDVVSGTAHLTHTACGGA